jgi:hypothetical protein
VALPLYTVQQRPTAAAAAGGSSTPAAYCYRWLGYGAFNDLVAWL